MKIQQVAGSVQTRVTPRPRTRYYCIADIYILGARIFPNVEELQPFSLLIIHAQRSRSVGPQRRSYSVPRQGRIAKRGARGGSLAVNLLTSVCVKGCGSTIFIQGARRIQSCWWRERIQSQGGSRQGKRKSDFKGQGKGHRERERSQEGGSSDQGSSGH